MPTTAIIWTAIVSLYAGMFFGWVASSLCRAVRDVDDELDNSLGSRTRSVQAMKRTKHTTVELLDRDHHARVVFVLDPPTRPISQQAFRQRLRVISLLRELGFYKPPPRRR